MNLKRGLPYGWWKDADFWITLVLGIPALIMLLIILDAWFS